MSAKRFCPHGLGYDCGVCYPTPPPSLTVTPRSDGKFDAVYWFPLSAKRVRTVITPAKLDAEREHYEVIGG